MPEPVAFYPLNARYKAAEKENRQPEGILRNVAITNGPYNEPGGAYMFHGTDSSYIEFPNVGHLNIQFSITLMCWVEPGGQDGPLFSYGDWWTSGLWIESDKFINTIYLRRGDSIRRYRVSSPEVLPAGKWVHVAASYDNNTRNNSLYINGHFLKASHHTGISDLIIRNDHPSRMGSTPGERIHFKGKIAKMKVFDVALNESQIQTSIRPGSCTFFRNCCLFASPIIPLIIETPVIAKPHKIYQTHIFRYDFAKQRLVRREKKSGINRSGECTEFMHVRPNAKSDTHYSLSKAVKSNFLATC